MVAFNMITLFSGASAASYTTEAPLAAPPVPRMLGGTYISTRRLQTKITCGCGAKYDSCNDCADRFCDPQRWPISQCSMSHGQCVLTSSCAGKDISAAIVRADKVHSFPGEGCVDGQTLKHNETCPLVCKPGQTKKKHGLVVCKNGTVNVTPAECEMTVAEEAVLKSGVTCMSAQFRRCEECDLQWCATSFDDEPCDIFNINGEAVCKAKP